MITRKRRSAGCFRCFLQPNKSQSPTGQVHGGSKITLTVVLWQDDKEVGKFQVEGMAQAPAALVEAIVQNIRKCVAK